MPWHGGRPLDLAARATPARTGSRSPSPTPAAAPSPQALLDQPEVAPIGLGARDSLRLEAGLCLYGHDIDATHHPGRGRRSTGRSRRCAARGGARAGGFPGADRILPELERRPDPPPRRPAPRRPRADARGHPAVPRRRRTVGTVTSGGFGPTRRRAHRHGLCRPPPLAAPGTAAHGRGARQAPARHRLAHCPSDPPPTNAEGTR